MFAFFMRTLLAGLLHFLDLKSKSKNLLTAEVRQAPSFHIKDFLSSSHCRSLTLLIQGVSLSSNITMHWKLFI